MFLYKNFNVSFSIVSEKNLGANLRKKKESQNQELKFHKFQNLNNNESAQINVFPKSYDFVVKK